MAVASITLAVTDIQPLAPKSSILSPTMKWKYRIFLVPFVMAFSLLSEPPPPDLVGQDPLTLLIGKREQWRSKRRINTRHL